MALPLEDVVVVSVEGAVTAPMCSRALGDFGARVIRIEPPGGEAARSGDEIVGPWSPVDLWANTSKEGLTLDIKQPQAIEILLRLIERADVFLENMRPGLANEVGLTYSRLRERNPRIVYCQISGFGQGGPCGERKAYDLILQGEAGLIELTGTPEVPSRLGAPVADTIAGLCATTAILAALHEVRKTGIGQDIDVSMLDANTFFLGNIPAIYWYRNQIPGRLGARHPLICPYGVYNTSDGSLTIAGGTPNQWASFCRLIERPDMIDDPRFATHNVRMSHQAEFDEIVEPIFLTRTVAEWVERLEAAGIPCGMVRTIPEVLEHPQLMHRGYFSELASEHGPVKLLNFPARFRGKYHSSRTLPPLPGEDNEAILAELGYDEAQIASFRRQGVIGT